MGFGFPTNLLISGKSLSKIVLAETEETVSESVCSSETIYFPFFEIVQVVLLEVPFTLTFKSKSILSTTSSILDWEVLNITFSLWLGKSIKGFSIFTKTDFSEAGFSIKSTIFSSIQSSYWPIICKDSLVKLFCSIILVIGVWSSAILKGVALTSVF